MIADREEHGRALARRGRAGGLTANQAARLARLGDGVREATAKRNAAIVDAADRGMPFREIAEVVGVGTMTVQRIVNKARNEAPCVRCLVVGPINRRGLCILCADGAAS